MCQTILSNHHKNSDLLIWTFLMLGVVWWSGIGKHSLQWRTTLGLCFIKYLDWIISHKYNTGTQEKHVKTDIVKQLKASQ